MTSQIISESIGRSSWQQACTHIKCIFSMRVKRGLATSTRFSRRATVLFSQISFSYLLMILLIYLFILKCRAPADLNMWCISSSSAFSCNVMTVLCFLGALPASPVTLRVGPMALLNFSLLVYSYTRTLLNLPICSSFCLFVLDSVRLSA